MFWVLFKTLKELLHPFIGAFGSFIDIGIFFTGTISQTPVRKGFVQLMTRSLFLMSSRFCQFLHFLLVMLISS